MVSQWKEVHRTPYHIFYLWKAEVGKDRFTVQVSVNLPIVGSKPKKDDKDEKDSDDEDN